MSFLCFIGLLYLIAAVVISILLLELSKSAMKIIYQCFSDTAMLLFIVIVFIRSTYVFTDINLSEKFWEDFKMRKELYRLLFLLMMTDQCVHGFFLEALRSIPSKLYVVVDPAQRGNLGVTMISRRNPSEKQQYYLKCSSFKWLVCLPSFIVIGYNLLISLYAMLYDEISDVVILITVSQISLIISAYQLIILLNKSIYTSKSKVLKREQSFPAKKPELKDRPDRDGDHQAPNVNGHVPNVDHQEDSAIPHDTDHRRTINESEPSARINSADNTPTPIIVGDHPYDRNIMPVAIDIDTLCSYPDRNVPPKLKANQRETPNKPLVPPTTEFSFLALPSNENNVRA